MLTHLQDLTVFIYNSYYDPEIATLLVPTHEPLTFTDDIVTEFTKLYDPMVVEVYNQIVEVKYLENRPLPRIIPFDNKQHTEGMIWEALLEGRYSNYQNPIQSIKLVDVSDYHRALLYTGIAMTRLEKICIPDKFGNMPYIFSEAFYDRQREVMTPLERMVDDYLTLKPIDGEVLELELECLKDKTPEEQFYHSIVLLILIRIYTA